MKGSRKRWIGIIFFFVCICVTIIAGGQKEVAVDEGVLELRVWNEMLYPAEIHFANNPDDIVTPFVEEKFDFSFKEVMPRNQQPFTERLNQFIATDNLPDYIISDKRNTDQAIATGLFADLTEYIEQMPNLKRWFNEFGEEFWARYTTDGRIFQIPVIEPNSALAKYKEDPYCLPGKAWALWAREDILRKAGYNFKSVEDIINISIAQGKRPTEEDFAMTPAVDSPEDFQELLAKISELNLSVGDKSVIPFSSSSWSQFHLGSMFDFGHWTLGIDGFVGGFLGSNEAKEYYKYLWGLNQEGLVDPDWIIQKDEQLQQKVASGRVAVGMYVPDMEKAMAAMRSANPEWTIRYIPWPKKSVDSGFYDIKIPALTRIVIRKDFPEIDRLIAYFDWTFSDEGLLNLTWGPEESDLWRINENQKRVFNDERLNAYAKNGDITITDGTGDSPTKFGLNFRSRAAIVSPTYRMVGHTENPYWYTRSFNPNYDYITYNKNTVGESGVNFDGRAAYGDGGENVTGVIDWYWSRFQNLEVGKLFSPENEIEWEAAWDQLIDKYNNDIGYNDAVNDMKVWFEDNTVAAKR